MLAGVTIVDPATTVIDVDVEVGEDAVIAPFTSLHGRTDVGAGATIGPLSTLIDTRVGAEATVVHSYLDRADVGDRVSVGPFAYLRPGASIAADAHIGTYVELKKSQIGEGAKVPHLTYVGDATVGAGANIGAGTIFANYDGVRKHHTEVGENAFIGSNTVLVAPVTIGDGAYTAAGSAIHEDVTAGDLGIARGRQHSSDGWVLSNRQGTRSAEAAARHRSDES